MTVGRWTTPDPRGYADGPNLYAYVRNNPLTTIDLYGLWGMPAFRPTLAGPSLLMTPQRTRNWGNVSRQAGYSAVSFTYDAIYKAPFRLASGLNNAIWHPISTGRSHYNSARQDFSYYRSHTWKESLNYAFPSVSQFRSSWKSASTYDRW